MAVSGAGAAAIACLDLMVELGLKRENVYVCDSMGVIHDKREDKLDESKKRYQKVTTARTLANVMDGADVVLGCSAAGAISAEMVKSMAPRPIILALANPEPEIRPELAKSVRPDCIIATGRSDYPNQVNNVLCFPYIFRGALDSGATSITEAMKVACVRQIADLAKAEISGEVAAAYAGRELRFGPDYLIPTPFDSRLILRIAPAVAKAAAESGVATRPIADMEAYVQSLGRFVSHTGMLMRPLFVAARQQPKRVAYAEGEDERVLRAVQIALDEKLVEPVLIGRPAVIASRIERAGLRLEAGRDYEVVNPEDDARFRQYWETYHHLNARDGVTPDMAKATVRRSNTTIAALMVHLGDADAQCCAASSVASDEPFQRTCARSRPRPPSHGYATMNALLLDKHTLFILDPTSVNDDPNAEQLADIAAMAVHLCAASTSNLRSHSNVPLDVRLQPAPVGEEDARGARPVRHARMPGVPADGENAGRCRVQVPDIPPRP